MSEPVTPRLKVSPEGIVLIKSFEGFRPRAVRHENGGWVIGYGHTLSAREGASVSEADAELLLQYDLVSVARAVNDGVAAPLNQHQFDALASFAFSVGVERFVGSDVLQRLNAGAAGEAADALVNWPEPALPLAALRRRAAERALFVADPTSQVSLSDLLAAPLPPPRVPAPLVVDAVAAARAAAVASLLGESPDQTAPTPAADDDGAAAPDPEQARTSVPSTAPGPSAVESSPEEGAPNPQPEAAPEAARGPDDAAAFTVAADTQRYAPYAPPIVGALPEPVVAEVPVPGPVAPEDPSPGEPPLVLTPLSEDDVGPVERPAWAPEDRPVRGFGEPPLFEAEPEQYQALGPVLRHEALATPPPRFDWGETGAFLIMGAVGLVSFGMSMAAFRLASQQSAGSDETAMIGWVLAVIGVSCVGVSAFSLYRRWGRVDEG